MIEGDGIIEGAQFLAVEAETLKPFLYIKCHCCGAREAGFTDYLVSLANHVACYRCDGADLLVEGHDTSIGVSERFYGRRLS